MMKSPLAYIGGKSKLAKQIISMIPAHKTYCEVFAGGAWVFFSKEPSRVEVINDLDSDLISFYRCIQNHLEEFLRQFKWLLTSRELFDDWKSQLNISRGLTDIQRAARYYYVQRLCFGGRVRNRSYGVQTDRPPRINLLRLEEEMSEIHLRLCNVWIENLSWKELINRYDRPETFFYCDPPYLGYSDYKHNFTLNDFAEMAGVLRNVKGKWMLSINDHPDIRKIFNEFQRKEVSLLYSVGKKGPIKASELIYANFEFEKEAAADQTLFDNF